MNYNYYKRNFNNIEKIFRVPGNGKLIYENVATIEVWENKEWKYIDRYLTRLLDDYMTGWLIEGEDCLSIDEVNKLINESNA
ncbi:hypothetical protein [Pedobacter nototheniae]|uniref:hypothetical protein n=1 Tax=Pedobacter nototheniae TaxID=2488994 RepID=UPI002930C3C2|nr:hypothetical protein [Pedobacter nototheniae]